MLSSFNIGRNDAAINTCAPFMSGSAMRLGTATIPSGYFLSIRIYCQPDYALPVRLASVRRSDNNTKIIHVVFNDRKDVEVCVGIIQVHNDADPAAIHTCFLVDAHDNIVGHMAYMAALEGFLWSIIDKGEQTSDRSDLNLLPQCHLPRVVGGIRHIQINGIIYRGTVNLMPSSYSYTVNTTNKLIYGVTGPYEVDETVAICGLCHLLVSPVKINGMDSEDEQDIWIGGCNLVIKAGVTSNIRVVAGGSDINIRSVLDG